MQIEWLFLKLRLSLKELTYKNSAQMTEKLSLSDGSGTCSCRWYC